MNSDDLQLALAALDATIHDIVVAMAQDARTDLEAGGRPFVTAQEAQALAFTLQARNGLASWGRRARSRPRRPGAARPRGAESLRSSPTGAAVHSGPAAPPRH
jgi:hypothetical protein